MPSRPLDDQAFCFREIALRASHIMAGLRGFKHLQRGAIGLGRCHRAALPLTQPQSVLPRLIRAPAQSSGARSRVHSWSAA